MESPPSMMQGLIAVLVNWGQTATSLGVLRAIEEIEGGMVCKGLAHGSGRDRCYGAEENLRRESSALPLPLGSAIWNAACLIRADWSSASYLFFGPAKRTS